MSLFGQIKFILNNEPPSVQNEYSPANRSDRRRAGRVSHRGRKILVVDDSATIVAMFSKLLRSAGCVVWEAGDAETGLEIARKLQPDLVFLDIVLPGMNGFAALRQMRRDPRMRRIPVVIISGNEQMTKLHANRIGAADFMRKPFPRHEIFARLEMLVVEGKLPKLDSATEVTVSAIPEQSPQPAVSPAEEKVAGMTVLEARRQLASMGLQYFSQEQFSAAIKRKDKLTVRLFVIGRGIKIRK